MKTSLTSGQGLVMLGLAVCLVIPSTREVQRLLGPAGLIAYICFVLAAIPLGIRFVLPRFLSTFTKKQVMWLTGGMFLLLVVVLLTVYPIANSRGGSDRDDALNAATTELLHARYPYTPEDYTGNPITPLPGSLVLAVPFVLIGNSAYQNIFWLGALFLVATLHLRSAHMALSFFFVILALSPVVIHQLVTGSDLLSNALYILIFVWLLVRPKTNAHTGHIASLAAAIALGVGLSSRPNYIFIMPLVFSYLVQNNGWKSAVTYSLVTGGTFVAVTIPFYLYDPSEFSPLHVTNFGYYASSILPSFQFLSLPLLSDENILPVFSAIVLSLALAFQRMTSGNNKLWRNCALVQGILFLWLFVPANFVQVCPVNILYNWKFADFGISFMFFGALAFWTILVGNKIVTPALSAGRVNRDP